MGAFRNPGQAYKGSILTIPNAIGGYRKPSFEPSVAGIRDISFKFDGPILSGHALTFPHRVHITTINCAVTEDLSGMAAPALEITLRSAAEIGSAKPPDVVLPFPVDAKVGEVVPLDFYQDIEEGGSLTFAPVKDNPDGAGSFMIRADYYLGEAPAPPAPEGGGGGNGGGGGLTLVKYISDVYWNTAVAPAFAAAPGVQTDPNTFGANKVLWVRCGGEVMGVPGAPAVRLRFGDVTLANFMTRDLTFTDAATWFSEIWITRQVADPTMLNVEFHLSLRWNYNAAGSPIKEHNGIQYISSPEANSFLLEHQLQAGAANKINQRHLTAYLVG